MIKNLSSCNENDICVKTEVMIKVNKRKRKVSFIYTVKKYTSSIRARLLQSFSFGKKKQQKQKQIK